MAYITNYIFRLNGEVKSTQVYNGDGGTEYSSYVTAPSGYDRENFTIEWNYDYINSCTEYGTDNIIRKYFYYDAVYFYNNSNYVTCNFLYADNGEFASVKLVNGNKTSNIVGFGAYYKNSIVYLTVYPRPYYSLTGNIEPQYQSTWTANTVYRIETREGARITWKDYDGRTIRTDYIVEGVTPTPPNVSRTGYTHTGWSPNIVPVTGDATYTAQYTINYYHIRFLDDGGIYLDEHIAYGTPLNITMDVTKEDYEFVGWDPSVTIVTKDQDYYAIWEKVVFTIEYFDNETLLNTVKVRKGENVPSYIPTKPGYRFNTWKPSIQSPVYSDARYTATWNLLYTVVFLDTDSSVISSKEYIIGENIEIPTPPIKPHYIFKYWTPEVNSICNGDATYTAVYGEYTSIVVKFYDGRGHVHSQQQINIQGGFVQTDYSLEELIELGLVLPQDPVFRGRTFIKWLKYPTVYDEPNMTIIYTFQPKFISSNIEEQYYNTRLDEVDSDIADHVNDIELHIVEQTEIIDNSNTTMLSLHNKDGHIIDEINYVKKTNIKNKELLDSFDNNNFDEQMSAVREEMTHIQDEISQMDTSHRAELHGLDNLVLNNETRLNNIQDKLYNIPKHVVISDFDYKNIPTPDKNVIYFTIENK